MSSFTGLHWALPRSATLIVVCILAVMGISLSKEASVLTLAWVPSFASIESFVTVFTPTIPEREAGPRGDTDYAVLSGIDMSARARNLALVRDACAAAGRDTGLTLPLLVWADVRMSSFEAWYRAGLRASAMGGAPSNLAMTTARPIDAYPEYANASWSAWAGGALRTPVWMLTSAFDVTLDDAEACRLVRLREAPLSPLVAPDVVELWAPSFGMRWLRRGSQRQASQRRSGVFSGAALSREEGWSPVWESIGSRAEALAAAAAASADGALHKRLRLPVGAFLADHLAAAARGLLSDFVATADEPGRVIRGHDAAQGPLPLFPIDMFDTLGTGNDGARDMYAVVAARHTALTASAAAAAKAGLRYNGTNAWMYVPKVNAVTALQLVTTVDGVVSLPPFAGTSVTAVMKPRTDTTDAARTSEGYWGNTALLGNAFRAPQYTTTPAQDAAQMPVLFPVVTPWLDNYYHTLVEGNVRTALATALLAYINVPPLTECYPHFHNGHNAMILERALLYNGTIALCAALPQQFQRSVQGAVVHVLDAALSNWPDMLGIALLRERVRSAIALPQVSLAYADVQHIASTDGLGPSAARRTPLSLPRDRCQAWPLPCRTASPAAPAVPVVSAAARTAGCPAAYVRPPQLLVIPRNSATRAVSNWDALVAELSGLGAIITVAPEGTTATVREQLALFAGADAVIASHGAALANTISCAPGTALVEIIPERWAVPFYMHQALALGLEYHPHVVAGGKDGNVSAPVADVVRGLCEFLARNLRA